MTSTPIPTIQEFNMATGETVTREFTAEEFAQWEVNQTAAIAADASKAKAQADKAALLARLGFNEDELKTILG